MRAAALVLTGIAFSLGSLGAVSSAVAQPLTVVEFPLPSSGSEPSGIVTGPDGNLWFTEAAGNRIGRITPQGVITEFDIPTASSQPYGIAAGPDGNVWFIERLGNSIGRITPARPPGSGSCCGHLPALA